MLDTISLMGKYSINMKITHRIKIIIITFNANKQKTIEKYIFISELN